MSIANIPPEDMTRGLPTLPLERQQRKRPPPVEGPELRLCISHYKPVQRLRSQHKTRIKEIISFWQGYDGKIARCEYCTDKTPVSIKDLDVDHGDSDPSNNTIENLFVMHHACNAREYQERKRREASAFLDSPTNPEREHSRAA